MEADYRMEKSAPQVSDQGAIYEQYMELTYIVPMSLCPRNLQKSYFFPN